MLWAKGLSENEFVLRQRVLPVPTPVGRIIIIVIIVDIVAENHFMLQWALL